MNKTQTTFIVLGVAVLGVLGYFSFKPGQPIQSPDIDKNQFITTIDAKTIVMTANGFEPAEITVQKNTKVIFKNNDRTARWPASAPHPTHTNYPEFDPKKGIEPGQESSFVFEKTGSWSFHDHLNPSLRGKVTVVDNLSGQQSQNTTDTVEGLFNYTSSSYEAKSVRVEQGQKVMLKITSDTADEAHLHGYNLSKELDIGQESVIEFVADKTGRFDLELENSGKPLGVIEVYPK